MVKYDEYILWDEYSPEESVNIYNLQKFTNRVSDWNSIERDLSTVKELHILGNNTFSFPFSRPRSGCYINKERNWLLLLKVSPSLVQRVISQCCANLECLDMRFIPVDNIDMDQFPALATLKLMDVRAREEWYMRSLQQSGLKKVTIRTAVGCMGMDFSKAKNLEELRVHFSADDRGVLKVKGLSALKKLRKLDLVNVSLSERLDIGARLTDLVLDKVSHGGLRLLTGSEDYPKISKLENIRITTCEVPSELFAGCGKKQEIQCRLPMLGTLRLEACRLDKLPDLSNCQNLTELVLRETSLNDIGDLPVGLVCLDLSKTTLRRVPQSVEYLSNLRILDLSNMKLENLPLWLSKLGLPIVWDHVDTSGIILCNIEVAGVLQDGPVISHSGVYDWLKKQQDTQYDMEYSAAESTETLPNDQNEVKVVFLGDGEVGKSLIIQRLLNNGQPIKGFVGNSTPGISIACGKMNLAGRSDEAVKVNYWEFGGQELLHSMHRVFITQNTVYVVILNARNDTQDERARFWLQYLASVAEQTAKYRVMLVVNKIDQNPQVSLNETELSRIWPELGDVVYLSALNMPQSEFNKQLTERLKKDVAAVYKCRDRLPDEWVAVKKALESEREPIIQEKRFHEICSQAGLISDKKLRNGLVEILCEYGTCFRCGTDDTGTKVLLQPAWVTNAIYKILVNKHPGTRNGILKFSDIKECITSTDPAYKCVRHDMKYDKPDHVDYILNVMRANDLSFTVEKDKELIPLLCNRNANAEVLDHYVATAESMEVWWQFDYLPNNLFFRLIVQQRNELQQNMLWLTGAVFRQKNTSNSVLVRRDGNILKFYARGQDRFAALQYLTKIEDAVYDLIESNYLPLLRKDKVDQIVHNRDPKQYFSGIDRKIIFKDGDEREVFDFHHLKLGQINGIHSCYSMVLNRRVPVSYILTFGEGSQDASATLLLQDILDSCLKLQGVRGWENEKREDFRNTLVRDYLDIRGYDVKDQTFNGESAGIVESKETKKSPKKSQPGKLDLLISKGPGVPWAIYEGLNNRDKKYWEEHLHKLMNYYNSQGMKLLFLVTYLDTCPENFENECNRYFDFIDRYSPESYQRQGLVQNVDMGYNKIQVWKCAYAQDVKETTVYHILVQLGTAKNLQ